MPPMIWPTVESETPIAKKGDDELGQLADVLERLRLSLKKSLDRMRGIERDDSIRDAQDVENKKSTECIMHSVLFIHGGPSGI